MGFLLKVDALATNLNESSDTLDVRVIGSTTFNFGCKFDLNNKVKDLEIILILL